RSPYERPPVVGLGKQIAASEGWVGAGGPGSVPGAKDMRPGGYQRSTILIIFLLGLGQAISAQPDPSLYLVDSQFSNLLTRVFEVDPSTGVLMVRANFG